MIGWIKLSRGLAAWRWRKSPPTLSVWLWLLLAADNDGRAPVVVARIATDCGISRRQCRTALDRLTSAPAEIVMEGAGKGGKSAQILGWERYQGKPETPRPKIDQKAATKRPQNDQKTAKKLLVEYLKQQRLARKNANP